MIAAQMCFGVKQDIPNVSVIVVASVFFIKIVLSPFITFRSSFFRNGTRCSGMGGGLCVLHQQY